MYCRITERTDVVSVLANNISNNLPLSQFIRMPDKDKDNSSRKKTSGQKRKAQDNPRCTPDHIEVENGIKVVASPSDGGTPSTVLATAMQEGFTLLSGNLANAISEVFKLFKADFEISVDEEQQEEELLNLVHEDEPPAKYRC